VSDLREDLLASTVAVGTVAVYTFTHGYGLREAIPWLIAAGVGCAVWTAAWSIATRVVPADNSRGWIGQILVAQPIAYAAVGWGAALYGAVARDWEVGGWGLFLAVLFTAAVPFYYRRVMGR